MGQTLRVQVVDDDIVVTLPGYRYSAAFYKAEGSRGLVVRYSAVQNDLRIRMTAAEFRAMAWKAANEKARELGWIV
jgi:adenosine/AMP kinase